MHTLGFRDKEKGAHGREVYGRVLPSLSAAGLLSYCASRAESIAQVTSLLYASETWRPLCLEWSSAHPLLGLAVQRVAVCLTLSSLVG